MYCESQPRYPGKTWYELFPDDIFPNDTPDDTQRVSPSYFVVGMLLLLCSKVGSRFVNKNVTN